MRRPVKSERARQSPRRQIKKRWYSPSLFYWLMWVEIETYETKDENIQLFEDILWDIYKPLLGRQGKNKPIILCLWNNSFCRSEFISEPYKPVVLTNPHPSPLSWRGNSSHLPLLKLVQHDIVLVISFLLLG